MRIFAGGREVEIPTDSEGNVNVEQVREAANIPPERALIQQRSSGENIVMPRHGQVRLNPYDSFMHAPRARRG